MTRHGELSVPMDGVFLMQMSVVNLYHQQKFYMFLKMTCPFDTGNLIYLAAIIISTLKFHVRCV